MSQVVWTEIEHEGGIFVYLCPTEGVPPIMYCKHWGCWQVFGNGLYTTFNAAKKAAYEGTNR